MNSVMHAYTKIQTIRFFVDNYTVAFVTILGFIGSRYAQAEPVDKGIFTMVSEGYELPRNLLPAM